MGTPWRDSGEHRGGHHGRTSNGHRGRDNEGHRGGTVQAAGRSRLIRLSVSVSAGAGRAVGSLSGLRGCRHSWSWEGAVEGRSAGSYRRTVAAVTLPPLPG